MPIRSIIICCFVLLSSNISFGQQYTFVSKQAIFIDVKFEADSNYYFCYSNSKNHADQDIKAKKFQGKLLDGLSNLIDVPRNCIFTKGAIKENYIAYDFYVNTVKSNFEYLTLKSTILNYLEGVYNFKLRISDGYHSHEAWKFVLKDATLLPKTKAGSMPDISIDNSKKELSLVNIGLEEVSYLVENIIGYYVEVDKNIGNLHLSIPFDVLQSFEKANIFFKKNGIEVVRSTVEGPMAFVTFFD